MTALGCDQLTLPAVGLLDTCASETEFFHRIVPARIVFESDAEGRVVGLTLRQNGADHQARRLP